MFSLPEDNVLKRFEKAEKERAIFFMVDCLGFDMLLSLQEKEPFKYFWEVGKVEKTSSIFPSTTAATVFSFFTLSLPGKHGIYSWTIYKDGLIIKPLQWKEAKTNEPLENFGISEEEILPEGKEGRTYILPKHIADSKTNRWIGKNCKILAYEKIDELKNIIQKIDEENFIYIYYEKADQAVHKYGKFSLQHVDALAKIFSAIKSIAEMSERKIVIGSDHGAINRGKIIKIEEEKWMEAVVGEERDIFIYSMIEKEKGIQLLEEKYGDFAYILDAKNENLFGKIEQKEWPDILLIPKDNIALLLPFREETEIGQHGGISNEEREVGWIEL